MSLLPSLRLRILAFASVLAALSGLVLAPAPRASAAPAADLSAEVSCQANTVKVTFSWTPSNTGVQWLDVSTLDNGFASGTFTGIGPLDAAAGSYTWDGALGSGTYYARVNTFDGTAWAPTPTLRVTTPPCGVALTPVTTPEMEGLRASLEAEVAKWGFQTAVAVTDLQTGETVHVNGDRPQFAGCVMNFFALMQAVVDVQNGLYPESSVGSLISATVFGSNPVTARDILLISGNGDIIAAMQKVNELIGRLGLTTTFYDHPPAYWPASSLRGIDNLTTALEMNQALAGFWHGNELAPEWKDYFFGKLTEVKPGLNYLIPAGVTGGVVGHKNGFFWLPDGYIDNDTGIVTFQRGGQTYAYAITFLTQAVPVKYQDIPLGQTISSLVWEYFSNKYQ